MDERDSRMPASSSTMRMWGLGAMFERRTKVQSTRVQEFAQTHGQISAGGWGDAMECGVQYDRHRVEAMDAGAGSRWSDLGGVRRGKIGSWAAALRRSGTR